MMDATALDVPARDPTISYCETTAECSEIPRTGGVGSGLGEVSSNKDVTDRCSIVAACGGRTGEIPHER